MPLAPLSPQQVQEVYQWVNGLRIERTSSEMHRDFSDCVNAAKILHQFLPNAVEIHNYQPATSSKNKMSNWLTLNSKVLTKLGLRLEERDMEELTAATPGRIESLLHEIKAKLESMSPEAQPEAAPVQRAGSAQASTKKQEQPDFYPEMVVSDRQSEPAKCGACDEKDRKIKELEEDVKLLEEKVDKLQQLVRLKDGKNKALEQKIEVLQKK